MRVTESKLMSQAAEAVSRARERAAEAGHMVSTGERISRPSQDRSAWASGMRAFVRGRGSTSHGSTIARAKDELRFAEGSLATLSEAMQGVLELAISMGNETQDADSRQSGARSVEALRDQIVAQLNARNAQGDYLFAGSQVGTQPFDTFGVYLGDALERRVEVAPGQFAMATISGSQLAGSGIVSTLAQLIAALNANDPVQVRATISGVQTGIASVANHLSIVGERIQVFDQTDEVRQDFELSLQESLTRWMAVDPSLAASELSKGRLALEAARRVAEEIVAIARGR